MKFQPRSLRPFNIFSVAAAIYKILPQVLQERHFGRVLAVKNKGVKFFVAAMGATLLTTTGAQATNVRLSFGHPESYALYQSYQNFATKLGAAGLPTKIFTSGSLLSLGDTAPGIRDGLADTGFVVLPYTTAVFSESILIANLSMLATVGSPLAVPGAAMNGASMEYIMLDCPECQTQMKAANQVFTSGSSSQDYILGCTKPIRSLAEMKGKRIRTGAANFTRWAEYVGAVPVQMPGNETYDALSKGVLDCTTIGMADFYGQRLYEVANSVLFGAPGGVYAALGYANFNRDFWRGLTAAQRTAIMRAAAHAAAESTLAFAKFDKTGFDTIKAAGKHTYIQASSDIVARTNAFVTADMANIEKEMTEKYGVKDAAKKLAKSRALVAKWRDLTKNIKATDTDALAKLYWDQIYSKLDLASYGMN